MTVTSLIARIEAAQGPDRVLDWQIYAAGKGISWGATEQAWVRDNGARGVPPGVPAYTASLDAAASLVPEGWMTTLDHFCLSADRSTPDQWRVWLKRITDDDRIKKVFALAATPALALVAAALRAREAGDG